VTAFSPGDRVMALLGHAGGGQAERVVFRQEQAARVPVSCSTAEAAALPLAGLTALQALYGRAALRARRSPRVLVLGASGGIGAYGVQLAGLAGAHVTAVSSGPGLEFVAWLGADDVVDRREQEVTALRRHWDEAIREESHRGRADLLRAHDAAFVGQLERERGPITPEQYARLTIAAERDQRDQALAALELPREALVPIERVYLARTVQEPRIRARVRAALTAMRRA